MSSNSEPPFEGANPSQPAEQRFVDLEVKLAYLEKLAQDLNDVVVAQALLIEDLQKRALLLEKQALAAGEGREFPHEAPPHY